MEGDEHGLTWRGWRCTTAPRGRGWGGSARPSTGGRGRFAWKFGWIRLNRVRLPL